MEFLGFASWSLSEPEDDYATPKSVYLRKLKTGPFGNELKCSTMKYVLILFILLLTDTALAQSEFPHFLQGTWKMENKDIYERWDKLNDNALKGFSYKIVNGQMNVTEYLDISRDGNDIIYTATVLKQNEGKGVNFRLKNTGNAYTFENPDHDFPKMIVYQKLSDTEILVRVSDGLAKGFSYKMKKQ